MNSQLKRGPVSFERDQRRLGGKHKRREARPPKPGALWDKTSNSKRGREAPEQLGCLPSTFILMANLSSSVLGEMIRPRCFSEKCKLLDLPGAHCQFDSLF